MWAYIYHFLRAYKKCFFPYSVSYTEVTAEWKIADVHLPLMHYLRVTTLTRWTWYLCLFWASWTNLVCSLWLYIFLSCSSHLLFFPTFFQAEDWAEISEVFLNSQTLSSRARREYVRLPRLLFICLFFPFFHKACGKWPSRWSVVLTGWEREQKESGGHAFYGLPWTIPPFHFLELIIFQ